MGRLSDPHVANASPSGAGGGEDNLQNLRRPEAPASPARQTATGRAAAQAVREGDARESVGVDVKVVKVDGRKAYQYTAIDDCTRLRVLRLYRQLNVRVS